MNNDIMADGCSAEQIATDTDGANDDPSGSSVVSVSVPLPLPLPLALPSVHPGPDLLGLTASPVAVTTTTTTTTTTTLAAAASESASAPSTAEYSLPDGYSMMFGEDGQQYVTVVQDDQTYAFPADEFHQMQQNAKGGTIMLQAMPVQIGGGEVETPQMVVVGGNEAAAGATGLETVPEFVPGPMLPHTVSDHYPPVATRTIVHKTTPPPTQQSSSPQKRIYSNAVVNESVVVDTKSFKPIRVDNWGIFLLNRLQSYFQKKEYCDLTIRFPTKNAQIKVHSLVVNACTDFFSRMEREGKLDNGIVDMPDEFAPDAVAPIIRFMYTGRLDIKTGMYSRLHKTAEKLEMAVLIKLMDAQLLAPPPQPETKKKRKPKPEDPVKQIKKIKRIEKKFTADEKKAKVVQQMEAAVNAARRHQFQTEGAMPGKKLPIWKKRSNLPDVPSIQAPPPLPPPPPVADSNGILTAEPQPDETLAAAAVPAAPPPGPRFTRIAPELSKGMVLTPVSQPPPGAKLVPVSGPPPPCRIKSEPLPRAYGKVCVGRGGGSPDKPKVPRQIREMQQNLNFEKIRRTGAKNPNTIGVIGSSSSAASSSVTERDMSLDEIREMMAEQKKRLAEAGEDLDDDDYFDNDAGLDYDEADGPDEDIDDPGPVNTSIIVSAAATATTAKPILKTERNETPEVTPRKSVRFSLTPLAAAEKSTPQKSQETEFILPDSTPSPTKKRGRPPKASPTTGVVAATAGAGADFESTLDEFNKAVEEEEESIIAAEEQEDGPPPVDVVKRSRSGRVIIPKTFDSPADQATTTTMTLPQAAAKKRGRPSKSSSPSTSSPPSAAKRPRKSVVVGAVNQSGCIDLPIPMVDTTKASIDMSHQQPSSATTVFSTSAADAGGGGVVGVGCGVGGSSASTAAAVASVAGEQTRLVQEVIKMYPNLLKEGKSIKLKVMSKDAEGRSVVKHITLRGSNVAGSSVVIPEGVASKKLKYNSRKGRPTKVRETQLQTLEQVAAAEDGSISSSATGVSAVSVSAAVAATEESGQQSMDPSSEAEALSHVASGIAASLGLVVVEHGQQQQSMQIAAPDNEFAIETEGVVVSGPLSDLENYSGGAGVQHAAVMLNYPVDGDSAAVVAADETQLIVTSEDGADSLQGKVQILQTGADGSISVISPDGLVMSSDDQQPQPQGSNIEDAMAKLHEGGGGAESKGAAKAKLAIDWDDEEEVEGEESAK